MFSHCQNFVYLTMNFYLFSLLETGREIKNFDPFEHTLLIHSISFSRKSSQSEKISLTHLLKIVGFRFDASKMDQNDF